MLRQGPFSQTDTSAPAPGAAAGGRYRAALLLAALIAVVAEWTVHQVEYAIEYGRRFGSVMEVTPHRWYMGSSGAILLALAAIWLTSFALYLRGELARRDALLRSLPGWAYPLVRVRAPRLPLQTVAGTALLLALVQVCLYTAQENLEALAMYGYWPGLSVLLAPEHATVLPLHAVAACCGSLLFWLIRLWRYALATKVELAERLVRTVWRRRIAPIAAFPTWTLLRHEFVALQRSLRSPPLAPSFCRVNLSGR